jgi:flavin-dependent dehydrogenase
MSDRCEIAVIGGGIAGSALAALLARSGREVMLLEKDAFPRHKICGEFLSPESQRLLERVGCLREVLALGPARITHGRFFAPSGRDALFGLGGEALGLSRWALDEALFRHAGRRGASAREAAKVLRIEEAGGVRRLGVEWKDGRRTTVEARLVVAAYGRRSALDAPFSRAFLQEPAPYLGLKRHHRPADTEEGRRRSAELEGRVEIHLFDGGYCGLSHVEGGRVNVCVLLEEELLKSLAAPRWDDVSAAMRERSASLRERLAALTPDEEGFHAAAGLGFSPKETSRRGVLFTGDAAGMIAPLCGDGQAMALESAIMLSGLICALPARLGDEDIATLGRRWDEAWRGRFDERLRRGRLLQSVLLWAPAGETAVRLISGLPRLGEALVRATRGRASSQAFATGSSG